jgi:hypothetical protein
LENLTRLLPFRRSCSAFLVEGKLFFEEKCELDVSTPQEVTAYRIREEALE